jgi:hypothetical protein
MKVTNTKLSPWIFTECDLINLNHCLVFWSIFDHFSEAACKRFLSSYWPQCIAKSTLIVANWFNLF